MRATFVIPAAGRGARLLPLTQTTPKCLLEISGKCILQHQIESLPVAHVDKLVVVTGFEAEQVTGFLSSLSLPYPVQTVHNPDYLNSHCGHSLSLSLPLIQGTLVCINSDLMFRASIVEQLMSAPAKTAVCARNPKGFTTDLQQIVLKNGSVQSWKLRVAPDACDGEVMGPVKISATDVPLLRAHVESLSPGELMKLPCFTLFSQLVETVDYRVSWVSDGDWCEVDTAKDLADATRMVRAWK